MLNLTQYIKDGFQTGAGSITGAIFVDLTAAYDTINHCQLLKEVQHLTCKSQLTNIIGSMLSKRCFFVEVAGTHSHWHRQPNGLVQGSVPAPFLFNVYTNDRLMPIGTHSFIYADDLCLATQSHNFSQIETTLNDELEYMSCFYAVNHVYANPSKTQLSAFHLRTKDAKCELNCTWEGKKLPYTTTSCYLSVTINRTLSFRHHMGKTKAKFVSRNNILAELANTQWGTSSSTLRTTALTLCYSATKYACPVWERSCHAYKLDATLNDSCRHITGCLKQTNIDKLYCLAGIAPPTFRCSIAS